MVLNINEVKRSGSDSGTTAVAEAIAAIMWRGKGGSIKILNPTASMYYRVDVYSTPDAACQPDPVLAWTNITANTLLKDLTSLVEPYEKAIVYVKSNSAPGAYTIDCAQYVFS